MSTQTVSDRFGEVYFALCISIDTPVALGMWLRYKYSHESLARATISPLHYLDPDEFRKDYVAVSYLSKWTGLTTGIDTRQVALESLIANERVNCTTNQRIRESRSRSIDPDVSSVLYRARRIITRILGPLNSSKVLSQSRWSPGSTSSISRRDARVDVKMSRLPITVTPECDKLFQLVVSSDLHWCAAILGFFPDGPCSILGLTRRVEGNRVVTVPKNSKTDRVIAAEPTGNIFLQKAVGAYIRNRLKGSSVDLDDQTVNQDAARIAYHFGLSTLDLKSASDTISYELVAELLPSDWFDLLTALRCRKSVIDGVAHFNEKFSSMGNGFTFELESLIFYALSRAVADHISSPVNPFVYGDDIIVAKECYPLLKEVFDFCGFSINTEKSYVEGNFYESCGKHFFCGKDVTPPFQKEVPVDLAGWIRAGNRLINRLGNYPYYEKSWLACRRLGGGSEFTIPLGTPGDDAWVVPDSLLRPLKVDRNHGMKCRVLKFVFHEVRVREEFSLAYRLREDFKDPGGSIGEPRFRITDSVREGKPFRGTHTTNTVRSVRRGSRWVWHFCA